MPEVESVWDYPRPPRCEPFSGHIRIVHAGYIVAESDVALRVLETSHPPVFYLPPRDVRLEWLQPSRARQSFCEFKGVAGYWDLALPAPYFALVSSVAWSYQEPATPFKALRDHLAFYASRVDECWVDGERVSAQPGDFYGGWITSRVQGPFK